MTVAPLPVYGHCIRKEPYRRDELIRPPAPSPQDTRPPPRPGYAADRDPHDSES